MIFNINSTRGHTGSLLVTTMLDYAQIHIFDAVTTCGRYQGRLLLILILHNVMHDITSTLPAGVLPPARWTRKLAAPC